MTQVHVTPIVEQHSIYAEGMSVVLFFRSSVVERMLIL